MKENCAKASKAAVETAYKDLPENQRSSIQACLEASRHKDIRGIRYTNQWIYECLLLKIKSIKTYNHLRNRKILALPSNFPLNRYLKKIRGTYGFQGETFALLKQKAATMNPMDVRGIQIF